MTSSTLTKSFKFKDNSRKTRELNNCLNAAGWLWQQGVSFAWLALARDQLPQGNWTLSVWNRETFISTFTFLKICWNMLKYTQRMTKKSLEAKLSKESIHMLRCKIPDQYRSLRNVWDYMRLHGISDVPACQVCSFSVLPATNTFSHSRCQYQTIQMLKVKVFRE